ncbi:hypothetical protein [Haloarchaeobius sp. HME9146]|uniref:DUF7288 family protein n=1 Tax=Haloarchaeobius sp. HME9146 TaxID=2978732 RepID=UPI0021BF5795|nr:hypothetical protein [Haloarchaeobius sp. HME9146]MCT9096279.1 hypothetical protein [Haloarchaeobius sp. HME9146]
MRQDQRAQAYTLEGFIGSVLVLAAVLFALQSVVIMPTTSGKVSRDVQEQLRVEADDILIISSQEESLSCQIRHWNGSTNENTFAGGFDERIGYGPEPPPNITTCDADGTAFGEMLNQTFGEQGREYNIIVSYRHPSDPTLSPSERMVYRGVPTESAIAATYTVTLYDNQTLTGQGCQPDCPELWETNSSEFPIRDAAPNSPVYNVVEVRIVIW